MKIGDYETHRFADIFPMIEDGELEGLKKDIQEHGQLQPIVLYEGKILDGRNRYKAVMQLGLKPITSQYEGDKPLEYVISLNLMRRHLTSTQRACAATVAMPMLSEEAQKRQAHGLTAPNKTLPQKIGEASNKRENEAAAKAAKIFDTNPEYIRKAVKIKETNPELFKELQENKKNFSDVKKEERLDKIQKQREELQKEVLEKPTGLFDVVVIDPPWRYKGDGESFDAEGNRGTTPYPTMTLEEIKNINLPIKEDCVLWLWTTNLFIIEMKPLLQEWGFEVKSILTWDKEHFGTGRWLRSQTEHCILAIKGKPYYNNTKWSTLIREKRTEHSAKPEIFYKMVDEICAGRKLDYFSRKKRKGWEVYGDEIK